MGKVKLRTFCELLQENIEILSENELRLVNEWIFYLVQVEHGIFLWLDVYIVKFVRFIFTEFSKNFTAGNCRTFVASFSLVHLHLSRTFLKWVAKAKNQ